MVATRLYEVTSKGTEWAYGSRSSSSGGYETPTSSSATSAPGSPTTSSSLSHRSRSLSPYSSSSSTTSRMPSSYWNYANSSIQAVAETTYSTLASLISTLYSGTSSSVSDAQSTMYYNDYYYSDPRHPERIRSQSNMTTDSSFVGGGGEEDLSTSARGAGGRRGGTGPFTLNSTDLVMMFQNPYNGVRGRHHHHHPQPPASISAVRALLTLVPVEDRVRAFPPPGEDDPDNADTPLKRGTSSIHSTSSSAFPTNPKDDEDGANSLLKWQRLQQQSQPQQRQWNVSPSETASQIAEGTIRALRDLVCDEAVELQIALRFWTERWERPLFSWLEAGPSVWMSPGGYNHQHIGKKVAQIQAVLARRCATIGELQQHLLRAGWQRGVAQWGVLGHGGEWAAVAGFDGAIADEIPAQSYVRRDIRQHLSKDEIPELPSASKEAPSSSGLQRQMSSQSAANVLVQRTRGGGLFVDDPAFLTQWSVEAIALVRRLLMAASGGRVPIPHEENWIRAYARHDEETGEVILDAGEEASAAFPAWAGENVARKGDLTESDYSISSLEPRPGLVVTDLPLLMEEVSDLLAAMEEILAIQRKRRLEKFRPPSWLRRNWYVVTSLGPPITYILYNVTRRETIELVVQKIRDFFRDHLREPVVAIFNEIWKGRESFSDKEARREAMESLKKMIRSWLDDTFPNMPEAKRIELSNAMDVTLIEQQKVESMKTFFEINNVIRMSFIEMQYMKKELLNALSAIDEMMSANDINMNVAAITPVAMLVYVQTRVFRFLYYALLKLGKSREETYSSFRCILTDIERLLVMRDNPPTPTFSNYANQPPQAAESPLKPALSQELGADDLGMIMLLIHECRSILWRDRRRFSNDTIRSVHEDLAELAGERGAVSVRQQLQIIERMSRTYLFLQIKQL